METKELQRRLARARALYIKLATLGDENAEQQAAGDVLSSGVASDEYHRRKHNRAMERLADAQETAGAEFDAKVAGEEEL